LFNQRLSVLPASLTLAVISTPVRPPAGAATITGAPSGPGRNELAVMAMLVAGWLNWRTLRVDGLSSPTWLKTLALRV
jgi:hypothetical protein